MVTVTLRFDEETKLELDIMCAEMGMNLTTFFMIYAKKALRDRKIPFEITAPADPFYSQENMAQIKRAKKQIENGKVIAKTMDALETMADE